MREGLFPAGSVHLNPTLGETIDAVVTEAGVAVHPNRGDLRDRLRSARIELLGIEQLHVRANALAAAVRLLAPASSDARIVGVVEYRDGSVIDVIRQVTA